MYTFFPYNNNCCHGFIDMEGEKRMLCLQLLMLLLPPTHHIVLTHLLHLLSIVSQSESSLMTPHNLAVVFGPTLFLHKTQVCMLYIIDTLRLLSPYPPLG